MTLCNLWFYFMTFLVQINCASLNFGVSFILVQIFNLDNILLRWAGYVARMEEGRSAFKILTATPTEKRPLGRPMHRWEDNVSMDLQEIGINTGNWVGSAQPL